jgi:hypothetical protein
MQGKQMGMKDLVKQEEVSIKLADALNAYDSLIAMRNRPMLVTVSYTFSRALKQVTLFIEQFEEFKNGIRKEFGTLTKDKEGRELYDFGINQKIVDDSVKKEMNKQITLVIPTLTLSQLEGMEIEPKILSDLDWIILA